MINDDYYLILDKVDIEKKKNHFAMIDEIVGMNYLMRYDHEME